MASNGMSLLWSGPLPACPLGPAFLGGTSWLQERLHFTVWQTLLPGNGAEDLAGSKVVSTGTVNVDPEFNPLSSTNGCERRASAAEADLHFGLDNDGHWFETLSGSSSFHEQPQGRSSSSLEHLRNDECSWRKGAKVSAGERCCHLLRRVCATL